MLVNFATNNTITNLTELKMKSSISKHIEYSEINFQFSNNFRLKNILNDTIINMLDNIENRI